MRTRKLGYSDLELTTIGLGTWAIGGPWQYGWGPQDDEASVATILAALDAGINWIDTAPIYGCGHGEEVVGRVLREMREKPLVATKCGLAWNDKLEKINCLDYDAIITECESSLKRLGVEVIDLYQMHWPIPDEKIEECWQAMAACVNKGMVRYIGVCNGSVSQMQRLAPIHPIASSQPPYSMLHRGIEEELIGYCDENNIGVLAYSPMQKGLLTGKFSKAYLQSLAADDNRHTDPHFMEDRFERNLAIVDALRPMAARNNITLGQLALAWVLRWDTMTAAIAGARQGKQIIETAQAGDIVLSDDDLAEIEVLLK